MKKIYAAQALFLLFLLQTTSWRAHGQNLPEQNCPNGIPVCHNVYTQAVSYSGFGTIQELNNANQGCLGSGVGSGEINSVWYIITIVSPGYLAFSLTPNPINNDYDWALWDITNNGCSQIYNYVTNTPQPYLPVRCNASANTNTPTGMFVGACCPSQGAGNTPNQSSILNVTAGQVFALEINNYAGNALGYTLDFSSSTASIFDTVRPHFDSVQKYCGPQDSITVKMSEGVICNTIAADGSDFYVTPANAVTNAAHGATCLNATSTSEKINIHFATPLPAGLYVLHSQNGTDGNTTIDNCTNQQKINDTISFRIYDPPVITTGPDTMCGDSLQVFANVLNQTPGVTYSYHWAPNQYISNVNIANPKVDPPANMTYTVTVTQDGGTLCSGTQTLPIVVFHPTISSVSSNSPICSGSDLTLTATGTGNTYSWTGPNGFTSTQQNPDIPNAQTNASGVYSVTVSEYGCTSPAGTTTVVVNQTPQITGYLDTNPTTCHGSDGTITLQGLLPNTPFTVYLTKDGTNQPNMNLNADAAGNVIVTGLSSGTYSLYVMQNNCTSNTIDNVVLVDPPVPGVQITDNAPVCPGFPVTVDVTSDVSGASYAWVGPNGFASTMAENTIYNFSFADSGLYFVTVTYLGCVAKDSVLLYPYPFLHLTNVTADQKIKYGQSVQLNASGAQYYFWTPDNGTLDDPNIDHPVATPQDPTRYTVHGMDIHGCRDSAFVYIDIDYTMTEFVPSAFSPNGDGRNDVFRILNMKYQKLLDFRVYNRWGQLIFVTSDLSKGWDGTFNGVPQEVGVYNYVIIVAEPDGTERTYKGTVSLVR
jgi:gliding motility-associated-like protein